MVDLLNDAQVAEINEFRDKLGKSIELVRSKCMEDEESVNCLKAFAKSRHLPLDFVKSKGIFYLTTPVCEYFEAKAGIFAFRVWGALAEIHTGKHKGEFINMMEERIVIPLYTHDGRVCGLCGYDGDSEAKYIYCKTRFFNRKAYVYGEENLFTTNKPMLVGEGLVDGMWLDYIGKSYGYSGFSTCGVRLDNIKVLKLKLGSQGVWYFPDRDDPGMKLKAKLCQKLDNIKIFYVGYGTKDPSEYFALLDDNGDENVLANILSMYESGEISDVDLGNEVLI